jgi:hypothetical protein
MAAKEISVKKYVVRLSGEERERLETLIRKGKSPARRVLKARILLKADVSEAGKGWSDNRIIEALETSPSMVYRARKLVAALGIGFVVFVVGGSKPCERPVPIGKTPPLLTDAAVQRPERRFVVNAVLAEAVALRMLVLVLAVVEGVVCERPGGGVVETIRCA